MNLRYEDPSTSIMFMRSLNGGATWSSPVTIGGDSTDGARPVVGGDGSLVIVWVDRGRNQVLAVRSTDQGATFSNPVTVAAHDDNLNTPPPGIGRSLDFNAAWPRAYSFSNFPSVAVDLSSGPRRGRLYTAWVQQAQGVTGPLAGVVGEQEPNDSPSQATSFSIGQTFVGGVPSSDNGFPTLDYFGFEGQVGQTISLTGREQWEPWPDFIEPGLVVMFCPDSMSNIEMVRTGAVPMGGEVEPPMVLTLPSTGRFYIQQGGAGQYSVSYSVSVSNFAVSPSSVARDHRDAVLTWSDDGGQTWAPLRRISDGPPGFADALPEVAVDDQGRLHVAWYDFRTESHCGSRAVVRWRESTDGGLTFHPSEPISDYASSWHTGDTVPFPGWHMALTTVGSQVHVAWVDGRDRELVDANVGSEIYAASFNPDDVTGTAISRFDAEAAPSGVMLRWRITDDGDVLRFALHHSREADGLFEPVAISLPLPDGRVELDYEVADMGAEPGYLHFYRLEVVKRDGSSVWSTPIRVELPPAARRLAWAAARPNPFASLVQVSLANPGRAHVNVVVHDLRGGVVSQLYEGDLPAGTSRWTWDGRRSDGSTAPPGVYLIRASGDGAEATQRIVRVR
ncbi:MAG: hypothetical protein IT348_13990 [Candidatus Eisenbacteria bacterium]|nr:hypothetical protein [Candidatus Eisenbacteria bacterium]